MEKNICPQCGAHLPDGENKCEKCGFEIVNSIFEKQNNNKL